MQKDLNIAGMLWSWHQSHFSLSKKSWTGLGQEMDICLKASKIKPVLSLHAQPVFKFSSCLFKEKNKWKVSVCFFENTLSFQKLFQIVDFRLCSLLLVDFLQCTHHSRLWNYFQDHRRLPVDILRSNYRCRVSEEVNERIFNISK